MRNWVPSGRDLSCKMELASCIGEGAEAGGGSLVETKGRKRTVGNPLKWEVGMALKSGKPFKRSVDILSTKYVSSKGSGRRVRS